VRDACSSGVFHRDDEFDAGDVGGAEYPALAAGDVEGGDVVGELAAVGGVDGVQVVGCVCGVAAKVGEGEGCVEVGWEGE